MITLIGFMGSGKSAVGKKLAKKLRLRLVETDNEIKKQYGSIDKIFSQMGEKKFRKMESSVIKRLPRNAVISTGGGAVLRKSNVAVIRGGFVVWLRASIREIWRRTKGRRPLLKGKYQNIVRLLRRREKLYFNASDIIIDTDGRSENEIAEGIAKIARVIK